MIFGGEFVVPDEAETVIPKIGISVAIVTPSDTCILILLKVPVAVGVPLRRPVDALKLAHEGLFVILNVSGLPSGSEAVGVKL